ncbi:efflux RND transporter periplasmic adaptor subunit [Paraherbaspirillum soli]|uniref:Efflux RND transporter periplasmic adaptor subunit n=1 Tax=Paraherbaspirillum soli TaxID=631222 RepID=A0ABW0MB88_9BURK
MTLSHLSAALLIAASVIAQQSSAAESAVEAGKDGRIRVQFVAFQQSVLSSELSARIASIPFREGDTFRAGQVLVSFDCGLFRAQLNKAEAAAEAARQTLKVDQRLAQLNSIGQLDVDLAAAKVRETAAEAGAMRATVGKCTLAAPFAGRVAKLGAQAFEYVAPGKPLLEILDTRRLELQMIVPSKWLAWLKVGGRFNVKVDELDREYSGRIVRLGARIDPVSQSISLAGEVEGAHPELLPGMSGAAMFKVEK